MTFPCLTFCWGGLRLWRRAWWKSIKKREKWNKRRSPAGMRGGWLLNPALNICFAYCGLARLNKERHHLEWRCLKCDWQVFSFSEPSAWTIFILYWTYVGLHSSFLTGKSCQISIQQNVMWIIQGENWTYCEYLFTRFGSQMSIQNKGCGLYLYLNHAGKKLRFGLDLCSVEVCVEAQCLWMQARSLWCTQSTLHSYMITTTRRHAAGP